VRADGPADLEAVDVRQHAIESQEIRRSRPDRRQRVAARRHDVGGEAGFLEIARDELRDVLVVFDDENPGRHAAFILRGCTGDGSPYGGREPVRGTGARTGDGSLYGGEPARQLQSTPDPN